MQDSILSPNEPFDFPEGDHGVLLIHGWTGCPGHMRLIGEGLHERGFAVRGILLPGHCAQPEDMAKVTWQDWLQAARMAAKEMRARYAHFSVAGLSMGGAITLILAQEMDLTACVTLAAPMKTTNKFRPFALLAAPFVPMIHRKGDGPDYPTISVHHLNVIMRKARQHLSLVDCPLLAIQGKRDRTVTMDSPEIILSGVSSKTRASLWLDDAPHVCTTAPEYPKIIDAMDEFLRKAEGEKK